MLVLPLPWIRSGGELSELLLSNDYASKINDLLNRGCSSVGGRSNVSPGLTTTRGLEALHVVKILDADSLSSKGSLVAPPVDTGGDAMDMLAVT